MTMETFAGTIARSGLVLRRGRTTAVQVNVGLLCNQRCTHCRLDAGPERTELMSRETMREVIAWAGRSGFSSIDITGGAPELHPLLPELIRGLAPFVAAFSLRSNLTALASRWDSLMPLLREQSVGINASFPSLDEAGTDAQRGAGTHRASIEVLRKLNALGWGVRGTGLTLNLVANPAAAVLPEPESLIEERFRRDLAQNPAIVFNHLQGFANLPLGRFRASLEATGELDAYLGRLAAAFNPATVDGLMCRDTVAVDPGGFLFDCDFNLPTGLYLGGRKRHVSEMDGPPAEGSPIAVGDHCFACTAGAGFT